MTKWWAGPVREGPGTAPGFGGRTTSEHAQAEPGT